MMLEKINTVLLVLAGHNSLLSICGYCTCENRAERHVIYTTWVPLIAFFFLYTIIFKKVIKENRFSDFVSVWGRMVWLREIKALGKADSNKSQCFSVSGEDLTAGPHWCWKFVGRDWTFQAKKIKSLAWLHIHLGRLWFSLIPTRMRA